MTERAVPEVGESVGFIGVGALGLAMLERYLSTGPSGEVWVYDIDPEAMARAERLGAKAAASPREIGSRARWIDVVVRTEDQVADVVTGAEGVIGGIGDDRPVILIHSTVLPRVAETLARALEPQGIELYDAPVVGVPRVTRTGDAAFLVGAPPEAMPRITPHLLRMGKRVLHMGSVGTGSLAKIIKNLVRGSERFVLYEALLLAESLNMSREAALEMMRAVHGGSLFPNWTDLFSLKTPTPAPKMAQSLYDKDFRLAADLGRDQGLSLPITDALAATAKRLKAEEEARDTAE